MPLVNKETHLIKRRARQFVGIKHQHIDRAQMLITHLFWAKNVANLVAKLGHGGIRQTTAADQSRARFR